VTGYRLINNDKGQVLVIVMAFVALMLMSIVYLGNMMKQSVALIQRSKLNEQALYVAEAGINHALAKIRDEGFDARANFQGSLDTGAYNVTYSDLAGRYMIESVGAASGITKTISVEIDPLTPTALEFASGAGNDISIYSSVANASITGNIHANGNVFLSSWFFFTSLDITGDVSSTGIVKLGFQYKATDWFDIRVYINGVQGESATVTEEAKAITFPSFNYDLYRQEADDAGDYYEGDQIFDGATLSPGNGIVFIDGNVTFRGTCTLNGGIVADSITIEGTLDQNLSGERNVIIARITDINLYGHLDAEEVLMYAARDIASLKSNAEVEVNGVMLARRNINMWNYRTFIDYNYVNTYPSDMEEEPEGIPFDIVGWIY
jgi:hypothetical protein